MIIMGVELVFGVVGTEIYYGSFSSKVCLYIYAVLLNICDFIWPVYIVAHIVLEYIVYK